MLKKGEKLERITSSILVTLLFLSLFAFAFNIQPAKANGTIYIRADGSIDPPTAPISTLDMVTYTFTDNVYDEIVVERDNTVVDGAGYAVQGLGTQFSHAISLIGRSNVTIKNMEINAFEAGVYLESCSNSTLSSNFIAASSLAGVFLDYLSNYNTILGNNITNNDYDGVCLTYSSYYNTVWGNSITNNGYGVYLDSYSSYNTISGNNITNNGYDGICLAGSWGNTVSGNNITTNSQNGVYLTFSLGYSSDYNTISGNNIINDGCGVNIDSSMGNIVSGNNIKNNGDGVALIDSSHNNRFAHNNFVDNIVQVYLYELSSYADVWDDGFPSGGNYWSDYIGVDVKNGHSQDLPGSDGIGDTPYIIDTNNQDSYPLMKPYAGPHDIGITSFTVSKTVIEQGYSIYSIYMNAEILNYGSSTENFYLETYVNDTEYAGGGGDFPARWSYGLRFWLDCRSFPCGTYILKSVLFPVAGETDTTDNVATITVKVTIPGDVNGDFFVDISDAALIGLNWQKTVPPAPANVDITGDGFIDISDAAVLGINWQKHT